MDASQRREAKNVRLDLNYFKVYDFFCVLEVLLAFLFFKFRRGKFFGHAAKWGDASSRGGNSGF